MALKASTAAGSPQSNSPTASKRLGDSEDGDSPKRSRSVDGNEEGDISGVAGSYSRTVGAASTHQQAGSAAAGTSTAAGSSAASSASSSPTTTTGGGSASTLTVRLRNVSGTVDYCINCPSSATLTKFTEVAIAGAPMEDKANLAFTFVHKNKILKPSADVTVDQGGVCNNDMVVVVTKPKTS